METTIGRASYNEHFGGFAMWPDQLHWSFQFIRLVSSAPVGGADFTELYHAVRDIEASDVDTWQRQVTALAQRLDEGAAADLADGHRVSAREKWLRAANYYRAGGFFHDPPDPRNLGAADNRVRCFRSFAELADESITPVEVPYEHGQTLPGYLCLPADSAPRPLPGVVVFGGGDSVTEEMYLSIGRALATRGFAVLLVDGPGMGEALRKGIYARYDWEVPAGAAYDFLSAQPGVDPERIAIIAESLGGYYSARAAAMDHRFGACVVWGGNYEFPMVYITPQEDGKLPADGRPARRLMSLLGVDDLDEAREQLQRFTLDGVLQNMQCPVLLITGGAEHGFRPPADDDLDQAERIFRDIPHDDKRNIVYPRGTPGCAHCTHDAVVYAHHDIGNWLESVFRR